MISGCVFQLCNNRNCLVKPIERKLFNCRSLFVFYSSKSTSSSTNVVIIIYVLYDDGQEYRVIPFEQKQITQWKTRDIQFLKRLTGSEKYKILKYVNGPYIACIQNCSLD